ncbi:MAG: TVP38/TMEM64 family protein [Myxococcota bacterium]
MNDSRIKFKNILFRLILGGLLPLSLFGIGWLFQQQIKELFIGAPLVFIPAVVLSELLFLPRITVLLIAGLVFPLFQGIILTIVGDLIAAVVVWFLAKTVFKHYLSTYLDNFPRLSKLKKIIRHRQPLFSFAVLRIMPLAHYSSVSFLGGALNVPFFSFIGGTLLGVIPTAVIYTTLSFFAQI